MAAYVELPGDIVLRQPIALTGATMYCWLLDADQSKLRALCDAAFTQPSGGKVTVEPLLPIVMLVCADIARGQSVDPPDHDKGGCPERDFGFWVPVAVNGQLAWYQPYLFIDNEAAFVVGRETFGFRKYIGTCWWPEVGAPSIYSVDTLVIPTFTPTSTGSVQQLWTLDAGGTLRGDLTSMFDTVDAVLAHPALSRWKLLESFLRDAVKGQVPMVFLRQFRSIVDASQAAYQSIVTAPCQLNAWTGAGLAPPHTLTITPVDSHPIVAQLGLSGGTIDSGWGVWTQIDFTMANGTVLWTA
jgi:hypothetical protein